MTDHTLRAVVASLLPTDVGACCWPLADEPAPPWPEEAAAVAKAVDKRRREFAAGRHAARQALAALGVAPCAIPVGADRAPRWPAGIVGSISHDTAWCIAVAGASPPWWGLGIDIERIDRFDGGHERMICTAGERARLPLDPAARQVVLAWIFTAKEAVYKAQHPRTGAWLDFGDVNVSWPSTAQGGTFTATLSRAAGALPAGTTWRGLCAAHGGHAVAAVGWRAV